MYFFNLFCNWKNPCVMKRTIYALRGVAGKHVIIVSMCKCHYPIMTPNHFDISISMFINGLNVIHVDILLVRSIGLRNFSKFAQNTQIIKSCLDIFHYMMTTKTVACARNYGLKCWNETLLTIGNNCKVIRFTQ